MQESGTGSATWGNAVIYQEGYDPEVLQRDLLAGSAVREERRRRQDDHLAADRENRQGTR